MYLYYISNNNINFDNWVYFSLAYDYIYYSCRNMVCIINTVTSLDSICALLHILKYAMVRAIPIFFHMQIRLSVCSCEPTPAPPLNQPAHPNLQQTQISLFLCGISGQYIYTYIVFYWKCQRYFAHGRSLSLFVIIQGIFYLRSVMCWLFSTCITYICVYMRLSIEIEFVLVKLR